MTDIKISSLNARSHPLPTELRGVMVIIFLAVIDFHEAAGLVSALLVFSATLDFPVTLYKNTS